MVFPSHPLYLDPPNSWNQQQAHHQPAGATSDVHQLPPPAAAIAATGSGPARPGSTAERARLAKIPQPEVALRCPRCDSNNTKFCYFNNYSLSQPRHFCKTCRRYWTRGGALRSVPVGGGCRRNKRGSKSSAAATTTSSSSKLQLTTSSPSTATSAAPPAPGNMVLPSAPMSFLPAPWHQLQEYGYGYAGQGLEQWRIEQMQQTLPYLGGMEASGMQTVSAGMYCFHEGEGLGVGLGLEGSSGLTTAQIASVKMEGSSSSQVGVGSMPRQYFWSTVGGNINGNGGGGGGGGGGWMSSDISGFGSSSTGNRNL